MGSMAFIFDRMGWLGCSPVLEHLALFQSVLAHLDLESSTVFFCWIPYSMRNFMTKIEIFSQLAQLVRNQFNWFILFFMGSFDSF